MLGKPRGERAEGYYLSSPTGGEEGRPLSSQEKTMQAPEVKVIMLRVRDVGA